MEILIHTLFCIQTGPHSIWATSFRQDICFFPQIKRFFFLWCNVRHVRGWFSLSIRARTRPTAPLFLYVDTTCCDLIWLPRCGPFLKKKLDVVVVVASTSCWPLLSDRALSKQRQKNRVLLEVLRSYLGLARVNLAISRFFIGKEIVYYATILENLFWHVIIAKKKKKTNSDRLDHYSKAPQWLSISGKVMCAYMIYINSICPLNYIYIYAKYF